MKFIIDENMPLSFAKIIEDFGFPAVHVVQVGLDATDDALILNFAKKQGQIIITFDLDFSQLVAIGKLKLPSVITFRTDTLTADMFQEFVKQHLDGLREVLTDGALVTVTDMNIRVRKLPI